MLSRPPSTVGRRPAGRRGTGNRRGRRRRRLERRRPRRLRAPTNEGVGESEPAREDPGQEDGGEAADTTDAEPDGEAHSYPDMSIEDGAVGIARAETDCDYKGEKCNVAGLTKGFYDWTINAHDIEGEPDLIGGGYKVYGSADADFTMTTEVVPIPVPTWQCMSDCEKEKCQHAIDTILMPHEQQHVAAFETFIGQES